MVGICFMEVDSHKTQCSTLASRTEVYKLNLYKSKFGLFLYFRAESLELFIH